MEIITILGDSLSMVRPNEGINYKDTYAYKLNKALKSNYIIINNARRSNTIVRQTNPEALDDEVLSTDSSYFIIQIGICDCAPRLFTESQKKILALIRPKKVRSIIIEAIKKFRYQLTKKFPKTYVDKDVFTMKYDYLIKEIITKTKAKKIFIINIGDISIDLKNNSFGFAENIQIYNQILENIKKRYDNKVDIIDFYCITNNDNKLLLNDGYHINQKAHVKLTECLINKLKY